MCLDRLGCVLLAAGRSNRFARGNKLEADLGGKPLGFWALETVARLGLQQAVLVISTATPSALGARAQSLDIACVQNHHPDAGMGRSLATGARALGDVAGVFVALADMPFVTGGDFTALAAALDSEGPDAIVIPVFEGKRGHPVLFGQSYLPQLRTRDGDVGARPIVSLNESRVFEVVRPAAGILVDIDTDEALARVSAKLE